MYIFTSSNKNKTMKKTLELSLDQARKMLGKDQIMDSLIRANFSEKELSMNIMDRINSLQDALDYNGETIEEFNKRTEHDDDQERAGKELSVIFKAIREGKKEGFYYPYFNNPNRSGSGFSFCDCYCGHVLSDVGARHTADTAEKATYVGKNFTSIFNRYING